VSVVVYDGRVVRLHCGGCGEEVHLIPSAITLVIGSGEARYEFDCTTCGPRSQDAHPWVAEELRMAGANIVHPRERQIRDDIAELESWGDEP
jgi:hypothetical protein